MARFTTTKIVRPLPKGQITLPVAMRRALGITDSSLLRVTLDGDRIVIAKFGDQDAGDVRIYSDEEIEEFLGEDAITPETAEWVRAHIGARRA